MDIKDNISVVLVEPAAPGNIGAVARVLKNTGLSRLRLVNPVCGWDGEEARWMAHGSVEVLDHCDVYADLASALADVQFAVGTTHRQGRFREVDEDYLHVLEEGASLASHNHVAIVFGRERDGLWRREIELCQRLVRIPSAVSYPSFNLSHAVLLIVYELFRLCGSVVRTPRRQLATGAELERLVDDLHAVMEIVEFRPFNDDPSNFDRVLRRVLSRSPLEPRDVKVIHKLCSQIRKFALRHGALPPLEETDRRIDLQD